jgi:dTDP-4-dehydrorhamnose reductase
LNILLTGTSGQLGALLAQGLSPYANVLSAPRSRMQLEDLDQIREVIRATKPDLIINPAAFTAVVNAETEIARAIRINTEAPEVIAQEAQRIGAGLVHYSTDYVFDGLSTVPYTETDLPNPLNVYGQSKYAGELAVAKHCHAHWILRTSWLYSVTGNNFLKTVIRLAQSKETFTMVADQFGTPTSARMVCDHTVAALLGQKGRINIDHLHNTAGLYHLTAAGETSWHKYAQYIVDQLIQLEVPLAIAGSDAIIPVTSATLPLLPQRPKNTGLNHAKWLTTFNQQLPAWQNEVTACLQEIVTHYHLRDGIKLP